jgi:hypothetical protein
VIIDGAAGGVTKRRHDITFPLLTLHCGKDRVHFPTGFFQKENIVYPGVLQIYHTKNRRDLENSAICLLLMHDGISVGKIRPKQVGYFGT